MEVEQSSRPVVLRRNSITKAGNTFRHYLANSPEPYGPGSNYVKDLEKFMASFMEMTETGNKFKGIAVTRPHGYREFREQEDQGVIYKNVGVICVFANPDDLSAHAVAYVKMNDKWYVGDDENGFLIIRTNGPPSWLTLYAGSWTVTMMYYFYISSVLPVFPIPELNRYGFHGKISFKQHESSCWGDSIQTIIMNSNGYREQFVHLYNMVKDTYKILEGTPTDIHAKIRSRLAQILGYSHVIQKPESNEYKCIWLLSLSFVRMLSWETPYGTRPYVDHIMGKTGLHLLLADSSRGGIEGPEIKITSQFGGSHSTRSTRRKARK